MAPNTRDNENSSAAKFPRVRVSLSGRHYTNINHDEVFHHRFGSTRMGSPTLLCTLSNSFLLHPWRVQSSLENCEVWMAPPTVKLVMSMLSMYSTISAQAKSFVLAKFSALGHGRRRPATSAPTARSPPSVDRCIHSILSALASSVITHHICQADGWVIKQASKHPRIQTINQSSK